MEEKKEKNIEEIFSEAKLYVDTRLEYARLVLIKRSSKVFADLVTNAIVAVCFVLAFILGTSDNDFPMTTTSCTASSMLKVS